MPERPQEIPRQEFTTDGERIILTASEYELLERIHQGDCQCPQCEKPMEGDVLVDEDFDYAGVVTWCSDCNYWEW